MACDGERQVSEEFSQETKALVRIVILRSIQDQVESHPDAVENARPDVLQEIRSAEALYPDSSEVGKAARKFIQIVDQFNTSNSRRKEFEEMAKRLHLVGKSAEEVSETFLGVADDVFRDGIMNWGRIAALLAFAIIAGLDVLRFGLDSDLLRRIIDSVVEFINERISPWIEDHGGWVSL